MDKQSRRHTWGSGGRIANAHACTVATVRSAAEGVDLFVSQVMGALRYLGKKSPEARVCRRKCQSHWRSNGKPAIPKRVEIASPHRANRTELQVF